MTDADAQHALVVDAYEKQRTAAYRMAKQYADLLADAMYAFESATADIDSPTLDTVMEFMERTQKALRESRDALAHAPEVQ